MEKKKNESEIKESLFNTMKMSEIKGYPISEKSVGIDDFVLSRGQFFQMSMGVLSKIYLFLGLGKAGPKGKEEDHLLFLIEGKTGIQYGPSLEDLIDKKENGELISLDPYVKIFK